MHFIGMLACQDDKVAYELWPTLASLVIAIAAVTFGLWMVVQRTFSYLKLAAAGTVSGLAVVAIFAPLDFIARLAALVAKPRVNLTRFYGVFAPNSTLRAQLTPGRRGRRAGKDADKTSAQRRAAMTWAQRLKRVFRIDIETCGHCGGALRIIAGIEEPSVIKRILEHLARRDAGLLRQRTPAPRAPPQGASRA